MKIAYIAAGAGGMYCGSCMRDNALARALTRLGHPTVLVPTYTPLRTDEENVSIPRVFYGGIGVFLAQRFKALRRPLPFLDRALALPALLRGVAALAINTRPSALGGLTTSVLRGEDGNQKKALEELIQFLEWEARPEVVHLTNSLFAGIAGPLKRRLGVPVVASFQGEDLFLEGLPERDREEAKGLIRAAAAEIDVFVASSSHYADFMADYLGIPRDRIRVVPPGIALDGYGPPGASEPRAARPFTIGYLARIAPEKGLAVLCEAFRLLREELAGNPAQSGPAGPPRLRAAGYLGRAERSYLAGIRRKLDGWGLLDSFEYVGEVDRPGKLAFLREIDVLSVPATYPEALALYAYEALASGCPLVLPRSGVFPEVVEATGGGLLVDPGDPGALASGLKRLYLDPALRSELGRRGALAVRERFNLEAMARATLEVYQSVLYARSRGERNGS